MNKVFIKLWTECFFNYPICLRISQNYGKNTLSYYRRPGKPSIIFFFEATFFLTNPQKSNRRKFRRCRSWRVLFDRLHFSTFLQFQGHLELSSKIRSSLLYFSAAITFERFKTFYLHSLHAETETFTRERDLIPIGTIESYSMSKKIVTKCSRQPYSFNKDLRVIIQIKKIYKQLCAIQKYAEIFILKIYIKNMHKRYVLY